MQAELGSYSGFRYCVRISGRLMYDLQKKETDADVNDANARLKRTTRGHFCRPNSPRFQSNVTKTLQHIL